MKYFEILREDDVVTPDDSVSSEPSAVEKPVAATKVYYHVTTKARVKSIQELGIEPNRNRRWKTGFGKQLGSRGSIYLISDFTAAVRWAHKMQWEHFNGKVPEKSPYVIICVRESPANLEPDPHPENGLYSHTWFQKQGRIDPSDIMKIIPLTADLIKQVTNGGQAAIKEGFGSQYSPRALHKALAIKGWNETSAPYMYANPEYPEYSIEVDLHAIDGQPFIIYRRGRKLGKVKIPPVAQHMAMKDKIIDTPAEAPEPNVWD